MLRIHKSTSKKLPIVIGASICGAGALLGIMALVYMPELGHAESITYDPPRETRDMGQITYMQEITPEICQNSELEKQYQLKDARDQKIYWVIKLKNDSCWMTQNLELDLQGRILTSKDSDLPVGSSWKSTSGASEPWIADENDPYMVKYYNPGMYVETEPSDFVKCGDNIGLISSISECYAIGWRNVTGLVASSDPEYGTDVNYADGVFNGHYLAGYYYSGAAASAGTAVNNLGYGDNISGSICPKGWRIPLGREQSGKESAEDMLSAYGLVANDTTSSLKVSAAPFYFVRSGMVSRKWADETHTSYAFGLNGVGTTSAYWLATAVNDIVLTILSSAGAAGVQVLSSGFYYGHNVRCVVRMDPLPNDNVDIEVNSMISLDVAEEVNVEKSETNPSTANLDVKVSSNQKYSVGISASDSNLTSATSEVKIPAKSGLLNTAENGWGIKLKDDIDYTALTTSPQTFYTASGAEIKTIPFTIGISTALDIPNGEYSTEITVTATQN